MLTNAKHRVGQGTFIVFNEWHSFGTEDDDGAQKKKYVQNKWTHMCNDETLDMCLHWSSDIAERQTFVMWFWSSYTYLA